VGAEATGPQRSRLTRPERRRVLVAALAPVVLALVVLIPVGTVVGAGVGEIVAATIVYGGLLGLAAGFATVARLQARRCARCQRRTERGEHRCSGCGYDLLERPRYVCSEGHAIVLDDDELCGCGRRVRQLPTARGVGREVRAMVRFGAWLLALLIGIGLVLRVLERSL
jgi:hypothetical protein